MLIFLQRAKITKSTKPLKPNKIFPFMRLPAELRNKIYYECLCSNQYDQKDRAALYFDSTTKNFRNTMQPIGFWNTMKALLSADDSGVIFHWKDLAAVSHNCAGVLRGHSSQVARFALTKNSNIFFSVGMSDRTLIEWQSNIDNQPRSKLL